MGTIYKKIPGYQLVLQKKQRCDMEASAILKKAIEDYVNGDAAAFTTIYNESNRYIYVCINNVVSGNDNKEDMICDIMQDTYVEISKHINALQNVNQFLSWAGTIATRKCFEYIKKAGKYTLLNEDESFDSLADDDNIIPEEIMQNKEKQRLLREIIQNELTEMQKLCIVGYFYNEMKQSEIAKELGIPENSVKSHLLRAKAKIKDSVVDLEKNKGTKLYSVAPLLLLLFTDEVKASTVSPVIGQSVLAEVGVSTGQAATTIGVAAAKTAGATVGVKAVLAAAAVVTIGGAAAGVGIAIAKNNQSEEKKPDNVVESIVDKEESSEDFDDMEEVTTEEVTTKNKEVWTENIVLAECGQMYEVPMYGENFEGVSENQKANTSEFMVNTMVESISVTPEGIVINIVDVSELDSNAHIDFEYWDTYINCALVDKITGKDYMSIKQNSDNTTFVFDSEIINPDDYLIYVGYYYDWSLTEEAPGLFFKIPKEEPDDGLKLTLVEAAKKSLDNYGYADAVAFADYDGDGVPEFLALTGSAFGNLEGMMYKYENNEYVYCMDVKSFGDNCTRLYKDTIDGSYVVLEIDYSYETYVDEEYNVTGYYSSNEVYQIDVDTKESKLFKTIEGDDILFIMDRTFYNDDGSNMTAEEFFNSLDLEMSPQYEYVGDLDYGYEYYNDDNTELIAAYNYYLDNKIN